MPKREDPIPALKGQLGGELKLALDRWGTPELSYKLHTGAANVSRLRRGQVDRFSLEALIRFLARMNYGVVMSIESLRPVRERRTALKRRARSAEAGSKNA